MRLVLTLIDGQEIEYQMVGHSVTIGRSSKCDLVIGHEAMSRQHCKIDVRDGEVFITDLGSINGVLIDGKKIPPNSTVPFQTYLHLAFGAVQSAQFFVDEITRLGIVKPAELQHSSGSSSDLKIGGQPGTRTKTKPIPIKTEARKKSQKTEEKGKNALVINLLAFVSILFAIYYFLYADRPANTSESQDAPSAPPKAVETNDHF